MEAVTEYWGGVEGASEYQWMFVKDGERTKFDPGAIKSDQDAGLPSKNAAQRRREGIARNDPRFRIVREEDVGGKYKVTVTPKNASGEKGERKTSKPFRIC